jgi:hypothetical protein
MCRYVKGPFSAFSPWRVVWTCRQFIDARFPIPPRSQRVRNLVSPLLVYLGFRLTCFWYLVSPGSGISRETSRIYLWNLTVFLLRFSEVDAT